MAVIKTEPKSVSVASVPKRRNASSELAELMAMSKEDLVATADLEEVRFHPSDNKEVIARAILENRNK